MSDFDLDSTLFPIKLEAGISPVIVEPDVPGGVPLEGLAHSAFKDNAPQVSATSARIDPPRGEYQSISVYTMALDEEVPLLVDVIVPDVPDQPVIFDVAESLFVEGINVFYYVVKRSSGNSSPSTHAWALYHYQPPGGKNVPGTGDHPLLALSLPAELGNPPQIGREEAAAGVKLTLAYPHDHAYDKILLKLNGGRFTHVLTPQEQGKPIIITLTRDMFEQAGNSPLFEIRYTVISQLNNPTENSRESAAIVANVDVDRVAFHAPIFRENPNDETDDAQIIDRDELQGRPLSVIVNPRSPAFEVNDNVIGLLTVTPPGQSYPFNGVIESDGGGQLQRCVMQVANNFIISGSDVHGSYEVKRSGLLIGQSAIAVAKVIGTGQLPGDGYIDEPEFPLLNANGAIGLDQLVEGPSGLHNPVRVALTYAHAAVGDAVELFFVGYDTLDVGGNPVPKAAYNPQPPSVMTQEDLTRGYFDFAVPARHHFAVCSRGSVEARVIVSNASGPTTSRNKRVNCDVKKPGDSWCPEFY
jgi:hypothetical protein